MPDNKLASSLETMGKFFIQVGELSSQLEKNIIEPLTEFREALLEAIRPLEVLQAGISKIATSLGELYPIAHAVQLLGTNQFIFWEYISKDFATEMRDSKDIDGLMLDYYTKNESAHIKETISNCGNSNLIKPYYKLFSQSIAAYNRKHYHIAVMGLLGIVDGLLSDISENPSTNIKSRAEVILNKLKDDVELSQEDIAVWILISTFMDFVESIARSEPFDEEEPTDLNRHWIMHGRTRRELSRLDCIKIILSIHGILLFDKLNSADYL